MATNSVAGTTLPRDRFAAAGAFVRSEQLLLFAFAGVAAAIGAALPQMVVGDTWLAVVDGRWITHHGLPHTDAMTLWTHGARWIDQQWLAHLTMYELMRIGGIGFLLAVAVLLDLGSVSIAVIASRRNGVSARATAVCMLAPFVAAPHLLQARTQSLALPLFVGVYSLIAAESRRPSRRIWLSVPLLVLWANVHGTVVMGAGLLGLHAITTRRPLRDRIAVALAAPLTVLASPYGSDLVQYYKTMLVSAPLRQYDNEWQRPSLTLAHAGFFVLAAAIVFLVVRNANALPMFERIALPLLVVAGLVAVRNTGWVAWAFACSGGALLDRQWAGARVSDSRAVHAASWVSAAALGAALVLLGVRLAQSNEAVASHWPSAAAAKIAAAAGTNGTVFADDAHSDWLMWEEPRLTGRIAYDIRFELFTRRQFAELQSLRDGTSQAAVQTYDVITYATATERAGLRAAGALTGVRPVFSGSNLVAVADS